VDGTPGREPIRKGEAMARYCFHCGTCIIDGIDKSTALENGKVAHKQCADQRVKEQTEVELVKIVSVLFRDTRELDQETYGFQRRVELGDYFNCGSSGGTVTELHVDMKPEYRHTLSIVMGDMVVVFPCADIVEYVAEYKR
jgi:hypothetical protein